MGAVAFLCIAAFCVGGAIVAAICTTIQQRKLEDAVMRQLDSRVKEIEKIMKGPPK